MTHPRQELRFGPVGLLGGLLGVLDFLQHFLQFAIRGRQLIGTARDLLFEPLLDLGALALMPADLLQQPVEPVDQQPHFVIVDLLGPQAVVLAVRDQSHGLPQIPDGLDHQPLQDQGQYQRHQQGPEKDHHHRPCIHHDIGVQGRPFRMNHQVPQGLPRQSDRFGQRHPIFIDDPRQLRRTRGQSRGDALPDIHLRRLAPTTKKLRGPDRRLRLQRSQRRLRGIAVVKGQRRGQIRDQHLGQRRNVLLGLGAEPRVGMRRQQHNRQDQHQGAAQQDDRCQFSP